jgi:hypothetical protein
MIVDNKEKADVAWRPGLTMGFTSMMARSLDSKDAFCAVVLSNRAEKRLENVLPLVLDMILESRQ